MRRRTEPKTMPGPLREIAEALETANDCLAMGRKIPEPAATEYIDEAARQLQRAMEAFQRLHTRNLENERK